MFNNKDNEGIKANALVCVLQANEYNYAKFLWDDEEEWKKAWITKKMRKWALLYPLRSQQSKARQKRKQEEAETSAKRKKIGKSKGQSKAKNQVKDKTEAKSKAEGKRKV